MKLSMNLHLLAHFVGHEDADLRAAARYELRLVGRDALPALRAAKAASQGRARRLIADFYVRLVDSILDGARVYTPP